MLSLLLGPFPHVVSPFPLDQASHMAARSHGEGLELCQKHPCYPGKPQGRLLSKQRDVPQPSLAFASLSVIGFFRVCGKTCYQSLACLTVAKYDQQSDYLHLSHHIELYILQRAMFCLCLTEAVGGGHLLYPSSFLSHPPPRMEWEVLYCR